LALAQGLFLLILNKGAHFALTVTSAGCRQPTNQPLLSGPRPAASPSCPRTFSMAADTWSPATAECRAGTLKGTSWGTAAAKHLAHSCCSAYYPSGHMPLTNKGTRLWPRRHRLALFRAQTLQERQSEKDTSLHKYTQTHTVTHTQRHTHTHTHTDTHTHTQH
jgi:hypothetical protein